MLYIIVYFVLSGELGWELFVRKDKMLPLYQAVLEAGNEFNITKFGKFALDSLRQEKGLRGWANEVSLQYI